MVVYQHKITRYFNAKVRDKVFKVDDLVLQEAKVSHPGQRGKLTKLGTALSGGGGHQAENLPIETIGQDPLLQS